MTVTATSSDIANASMNEMPSGRKNCPSSPERKSTGENTSRMIADDAPMAPRISSFAAISTAYFDLRSCGGSAAFRESLRQAISTKIIALSTTSPTATARPPSVMMFTAMPNAGNSIIANRTDSGIAASVTSAVRTFSSVRKMTSMTTMPAVTSVSAPLARDISMKSDWR